MRKDMKYIYSGNKDKFLKYFYLEYRSVDGIYFREV